MAKIIGKDYDVTFTAPPQISLYIRTKLEAGVSAMAPPSSDLKLLGSWASSYTHRVQLALRLKGLDFEYAEEDLAEKSPSLLLHNPVYEKVPVLLHRGRPVLESVIILHYLDETWPEVPLMPADPYDRALARFWCHFVDDKVTPISCRVT